MEFDPAQHPHRRQNLLTGDWVLVSPHRALRPWQGQVERAVEDVRPAYDPQCYLCPANVRASGEKNPSYTSTYAFTNDFPALLPDIPDSGRQSPDLCLQPIAPVSGTSRVLCFSPRHDLSLAEMEPDDIESVVTMWVDQTEELAAYYQWVQVFENKGAAMGCSNPHPHGQIWAGDFLPTLPGHEDERQRAWGGHNMLLDYLELEIQEGERIVEQNDHWVLLVPYWATWPFEYLLLPRRHVTRLTDLNDAERRSLAVILSLGLVRYDNLFETSFPYSMGWHGAPFNGASDTHWQLHAHFYPPLLRSATVRKFMVGYEMLAEPQRDITPEQAAERLKSVPTTHYRSNVT